MYKQGRWRKVFFVFFLSSPISFHCISEHISTSSFSPTLTFVINKGKKDREMERKKETLLVSLYFPSMLAFTFFSKEPMKSSWFCCCLIYCNDDQSKDALNVKNTRWRKYCWKAIGNIFDSEGIRSPKDSKLCQCSPDHVHLRHGGYILRVFGAAGMTQLVASGAIRGVSNETENMQ